MKYAELFARAREQALSLHEEISSKSRAHSSDDIVLIAMLLLIAKHAESEDICRYLATVHAVSAVGRSSQYWLGVWNSLSSSELYTQLRVDRACSDGLPGWVG